jgi:hypothetical protein
METSKKFEDYPTWTVILTNLFSLAIYALGIAIMIRVGVVFAILYLIYVLILEYRVMRYHCINCYYWGKKCGFGKGRLSAIFFKRGNISKFCIKDMSWKDMIPDLLVTLIPIVVGIVLVIINFSFVLLLAILLLIILTTIGNGYIRGTLTCKYCKQKVLGCPADKLFNKEQ